MAVDVSVIIPVYNSECSLEELYRRLTGVLDGTVQNYEIILVDDASSDRSFARAKLLHGRDPRVKVIGLARNSGQQNAILCGLRFATGEIVITLDDDLQHPPEEIPVLLAKIALGYDGVFGVPDHKRHAFYRNLGTLGIDILLRLIAGKPRELKLSSFRALRKTLVCQIQSETMDFIYLAPLILKYTRNLTHVTVKHAPRQYGRSNYTLQKLVRLCTQLVRYYSKIAEIFPPKINRPQYEVREIHL
ncbi:undecaprenyl-phosphate 4-deoxy-4-formamido-L-arabinose transferase [Hydrogenispora ethanolica]|uniref:Undecaprenyl-phosphate 4-deoxy-4-formamido-L-arabinose transferase n=1 Tax=Hydrogenispora ethanolica TaxID=1082276 RepID=A0A4R1RTK1_HYDET|nr:glycosyltransferase family 2 protein [Hydrogenispora ethanolica]TCL69400.1 undecaprenyl-phosphate 4-deoxy-4-formamido-L-arabinose transferase [Hydrogenispora ethanolica]